MISLGWSHNSCDSTKSVCCPMAGPAHLVLPGVLLRTGRIAGTEKAVGWDEPARGVGRTGAFSIILLDKN